MKELVINKWVKVYLIFFVVTFPLFLTGCSSSSSLPTFNVTGNWFVYSVASISPGVVKGPLYPFIFTQSENDLSGTTSTGESIGSGSVTSVNISFSWVGAADGVTNTYTGTINADATMSGTWTRSDGTTGTWYAIIFTPPADIQGNWNLFITSPSSPEPQPLGLVTFTVNAINEGVASPSWFSIATTSGSLPGAGIGTVCTQSIMFPFSINEVTFIFSGSITVNGTMSGTWTAATATANGLSGTWNAVLE
ncbi:MAG: hypothetical protein ABR903_00280 [Thermodesulfovibrionales bacterium]